MAGFAVPLASLAKDNPLQSAQQATMESIERSKDKIRSASQMAEDNFEKSDFLKNLRDKSAQNSKQYVSWSPHFQHGAFRSVLIVVSHMLAPLHRYALSLQWI